MIDLFDHRRYLIPFRSILLPQIFTDVLVIGGGAAGLSAALAASGHSDVIVTSKSRFSVSNTARAQGGVAAALDSADSIESHVQDTLTAGAGLCDDPVVRRIVSEGPRAMRRLFDWGLRVDRSDEGEVELGREGGHSARRIIHAHGDATGREIARCLLDRAHHTPNVRLFEGCFTIDLITPTAADRSPCLGAITYHPKYGLQIIWAKSTVIATGGMGMLWRETTNPSVATGDGLAMAYRAGASVADLAFMQFHPTTLYIAGASRWLISEAVRGEGALLVDANGHRFMQDEHDLAELAPRDVVSRAIHRVLARHAASNVFLDATRIPDFSGRFPGIWKELQRFEIDPSRDLVPVNPAAHYAVGGIWTDDSGRTDVPGLYAVGESSCTGLHGANRLASNSLLETIVMGHAAGLACEEMKLASANPWGVVPRNGPVQVISDIPISVHGELDLNDVRSSLRSAMWRNVGIERNGSKLADVSEMFDFWARYSLDKIFDSPDGWETQNLLLCGALTTRSAAWRCESRGCHWRDDELGPRPEFEVHDLWRRGNSAPAKREVVKGAAV